MKKPSTSKPTHVLSASVTNTASSYVRAPSVLSNFDLMVALDEKLRDKLITVYPEGITKAFRIHPLRAVDVCNT